MRKLKFTFVIVLACAAWLQAASAFSADSLPPEKSQSPEQGSSDAAQAATRKAVQDQIEEYRKASDKAFEAIKEIGENLNPQNAKHFYLAYNNHNLISTAKMVQTDVGNAIKACGEANPGMKDALDKQYAEWSGSIKPVMQEAEANLENMVVAQDYAPQAKVKKVFSALDETRKITQSNIDKTPVTTKEACEHLSGKMDETRASLTELLRSTLVSFGRAFPEESGEPPAAADEKKDAL